MQECGRLETIDIAATRMASLELFPGESVWDSAPVIKRLYFDVKLLGLNSNFYGNYHLSLQSGVPAFSAVEQRQIWMRLQSVVSLKQLKLTGYPIDFIVVEDRSLI
jgi:hypothetical protein